MTVLLRIASMISLFFAVGHTLGGLTKSWSPIGETGVLTAMRTFRFAVEGVNRSYLEFYRGFGFLLSVSVLMQAVLLWQLATLAAADRTLARPFVATFFLMSIASSALTWRYLFPLPVCFGAVLTLCLGLAVFASR
jgi:hypothetical protein